MTTELEKQFFLIFDIKPKYQDTYTVEEKYWQNEELANEFGTFDQYMNIKCGNQENCTTQCSCAYQKEIYPQITDKQYLELICVLGYDEHFAIYNDGFPINVNMLKASVLNTLITGIEMSDCSIQEEKLKHQVQQLFISNP